MRKFVENKIQEQKLPSDRVYSVRDVNGVEHFFTDLKNCPVYYSDSIEVAVYEFSYCGTLVTTTTLMEGK